MVKWITKLFWRLLGWSDCPLCKSQSVKFHTENPIHPDGPPLITWWQCHSCGARTEEETLLMDNAAREKGYKDFADFLKTKGLI